MAFDPTAAYGRIEPSLSWKRPRSPSPPPPRPLTPEPIDTLPEPMRRIAELIGSNELPTEAPAIPSAPFQMPPLLNTVVSEPMMRTGPISPDPHSGVLREEGGIRRWLALRTRVAL